MSFILLSFIRRLQYALILYRIGQSDNWCHLSGFNPPGAIKEKSPVPLCSRTGHQRRYHLYGGRERVSPITGRWNALRQGCPRTWSGGKEFAISIRPLHRENGGVAYTQKNQISRDGYPLDSGLSVPTTLPWGHRNLSFIWSIEYAWYQSVFF